MSAVTRTLLATASGLLLSSCVLGPDPTDVEGNAPTTLRDDPNPAGPSLGDQAWRKVFTDGNLRKLIARALENNPDLVAATYRIEEARANAGAAYADFYPAINGGVGAARQYAPKSRAGQNRGSNDFSLSTGLSWELDLWGGIRRSNQAARARLLESVYQREAIRTMLIAQVATAYIDLQNLDARLRIAQRTIKSRGESLDLVTARREGGVTSDLEVSQAEALLGQARVSIPITERFIAARENEIRALLGENPGPVARSGQLERLSTSIRVSAGLPSSLLERRPDVAAANQSFRAATAQIGVAEALRLPTLALTGRGGLASDSLSTLFQGRSASFSIGPDLAGPIFDAGRLKFGAKAARARAEQARAAYDQAAKQAFREAADALKAYQKTGEIITEQQKFADSLKRVAGVARDRFEGGSSSYLEVLDAERSLFTAELDLADAQRDRLLAVVELYRALGGGWQ